MSLGYQCRLCDGLFIGDDATKEIKMTNRGDCTKVRVSMADRPASRLPVCHWHWQWQQSTTRASRVFRLREYARAPWTPTNLSAIAPPRQVGGARAIAPPRQVGAAERHDRLRD